MYQTPPSRRIEPIDLARGLALLAMAIYHLAWDLEFFGYAEPGMTAVGGWKYFARAIASSFLFLVGVSLVLAHGEKIRWRSFLKRLAMVAGAALAISLVTYFAMPGAFIFFGILHEIAVGSLLGLLFLRLPWAVTLLAAAAVLAAPHYLRSEFFDHPALWWVGLSSQNPHSNDYVPVFPWFAAILAGIAVAKIARAQGLFERLRGVDTGRWSYPLRLAGRHSLLFYLLHQPVLIACVWAFSQVAPAAERTPEVRFLDSCQVSCEAERDADFCTRYCVCVLDGLEADGRLDDVFNREPESELNTYLSGLAARCTGEIEE